VEKTLEEIARLLDARIEGNASAVIKDAAPLEDAGPGEITFLAGRKQARLLYSTRAGAVIVKEGEVFGPCDKNLLIVKNPQLAFARVLEVLRPSEPPPAGVHPRAEVHSSARLGKGVSVQAFCVVCEGAEVGDGTVLYPGVYVGRDARIGPGSTVHAGAAIRQGCIVGSRVVIHCNAVVGSDGFGFAKEGARYHKIPQTGIVRIGDDVEIGACVTIDRATLGETVIGRGTKIDNLVQIAHNVRIGEDSVIAAQTGIAGSSAIGSRVMFGGQVGIGDHVNIGDDTLLGAKSGVGADIAGGGAFSGIPAIPHREWLRAQNLYKKLPELKRRLEELEKRLERLEKPGG